MEAMIKQNIQQISVIGAGLMGFGIALDFARFGYDVNIYNTSEKTSRAAMAQIREALDLMVETGLISADEARNAFEHIRPFTDIASAAAGADLVVESVLEELNLKKEIFARLDEICPPPAILATNTSGFRVSEIAAATRYPERVVATHYFQPPHFLPLVEVVPGEKTTQAVVEQTVGVLRGLRKRVALLNAEIRGLIGNRLQGVMEREIQSLIDKGACTPETIDDVISFGFGRRMAFTGYFKQRDLIGLELLYTMAKNRGQEPWTEIKDRVERGDLGMKTGKGFYDWPEGSGAELQRRTNQELIRMMMQDMSAGRI
jgi:3-hydroxybutyryl-CoA dehydrogenase